MAAADAAGDDGEFFGGTVGFQVHVADEFGAGENGEGVVAAFSFGGGRVHFPGVVEVPESEGQGAIIDEGIQRRDELSGAGRTRGLIEN